MKHMLVAMGLLSATALASADGMAVAEPLPSSSPAVERPFGYAAFTSGDRVDGRLVHLAQAESEFGRRGRRADDHHEDGGSRDERHAEDRDRDHAGHHRWARGDHHDFRLELAERLSTAETLVGIRSDQLDPWRDYTTAVLDFFDRPEREPRPEGDETSPPSSTDAGQPPLLSERIADRVIAQAEKAQRLKDAIQALRGVLTPGQLERLAEAERLAAPPHMRHGPGGR